MTLKPYMVLIWSRNTPESLEGQNRRSPLSGVPTLSSRIHCSIKKREKERERERERERETDRQTDRQSDRQTDRDRQKERERERQKERGRELHY